ncbi:MAG: gamma-glutamyltransferase [Ignavibacteriales bacterium]|nr:gamma-glutamyltransferase [Ignavibacteriales bacterium]
MVVSADRLASEVGLSILKKGGNAVDAAVAIGFTLAVVFPEAGNIGGGGFMLIRENTGKSVVIDFRETSPKSAWRDMYLDSLNNVSKNSVRGVLSAGVPGTVAGLLKALKDYGTMSTGDVITPAIDIAENGFIVNRRLEEKILEYETDLRAYPSTIKAFFKNGNRYVAGDTLVQPDLAKTLRRIRNHGVDEFYAGETANMILNQMQNDGGLITKEDLKNYTPKIREPLRGSYRGYEIISIPPPSSGGVCLIEMLNILENYNLHAMGFHSSKSVHVISEAMKRVYSDRSEYLGDPEFTRVPTDILISKKYAVERSSDIDTMKSAISGSIKPGIVDMKDHPNTTHYAVIDSLGNCVSVTYTINDIFGSQVIVAGAGFFLNDEMDDFSSKPGIPNSYGLIGGYANSIEPRKRPLSSMTPTIVTKDGKPIMILGARGGSAIITSVLQTIINVIDFKMDISSAVNTFRFHHQWMPDTLFYEKFCLPIDVNQNLKIKGHNPCEKENYYGAVQAIMIDPEKKMIYANPDFREGGSAKGY